jgi:hypothetical protein
VRLVQKHQNLRRIFLTFLFALVLSGSVVHGSQFAVETASSCSFSPSTGDIYGYRISQNEIFDACTTEGTAPALPDQLVIRPGIYLLSFPKEDGGLFSRVISATKPGVYKFIVPGLGSRQFQVWWPKLGVTRLMTDLGYLYVHGNRDDQFDMGTLASIGTQRNLSVTCGTISNLTRSILKKFQIESRIVVSRTLERPYGLDDGHIMLEIRDGKSWVLFDPDSRSFFGTKKHKLGVADLPIGFVPLVGKNIQVYGPLMMVDVGGFLDAKGNDLSFLEQRSRISSVSLTKWYRRVLEVVGVEIDGTYYFNNRVDDRRLQVIQSQFPTNKLVSSKFLRR